MPLYEYRCGKCGKLTEVIQSFSEKPLRICPHCGVRALKKLMSAPAIQFKGSGWYVTDYAGKTGESREPAAGSSDKGESKDSKKSEKSDKSEKAEKQEKADKTEKADKAGKKGSRKD
jgi:putative FmdB family regulatory protein